MGFLWFILIGGIAGWLAGQIMRGKGYGILGNIVIGIIGALIGGWLFGLFGIEANRAFWGSLITATVGAVVAIFVARLLTR